MVSEEALLSDFSLALSEDTQSLSCAKTTEIEKIRQITRIQIKLDGFIK
jgi:hypothetical protein